MESRAKILGHPVHPMLIVFPLGLLVTAVIFDLIDLLGGSSVFGQVGFWNITAALIGGVIAAVAGLIDYFAIPAGTRAKRVGRIHGLTNLAVMVVFALVWLTRLDGAHQVGALAFVVELVALGAGGFSAWLGGELVDRLGVGVDERANLNASNSLTGRPA